MRCYERPELGWHSEHAPLVEGSRLGGQTKNRQDLQVAADRIGHQVIAAERSDGRPSSR